ncbi:MAG: sigma-70 family RNA polymerase sigma factor [Rhodospirillales bacterium]|nr:sigma-70 family RNA polymerase sigma factor [Rhodospirillales bacterium]
MVADPAWSEWLAAAQEGDRRAYGRLLRAAVPVLRGWARARWPAASAADIEDIVQETLLALHRSLALYDPARPAAPFLFGILKLRGADVLRQRHRHSRRETPIDDADETSVAFDTNAVQESHVEQARLRAAIALLPPRDREILEMLKLRQMSLRDVAGQLHMSVPAVKIASFRAVRRLRAAMKWPSGTGA